MKTFKKKWKQFWKSVWEYIKGSFTPAIMYFAASLIVLYVLSKMGETVNTKKLLAWSIGVGVFSVAYSGLILWNIGGQHYEMLVSGNMKRTTDELNMNTYKSEKEYRPWKGFVMGLLSVWAVIVGSIILGCNQSALTAEGSLGKGLNYVVLIFDCLGGWILIPFQMYNRAGIYANCFWGIAFAIIPIIVSGGTYIWGAYARRNKRLKEQEARLKAMEAEANKPKKINYGGLPGTKPRKKK